MNHPADVLRDRDLRQREIVPPERLAAVHALVIGVGAIAGRWRCNWRRSACRG